MDAVDPWRALEEGTWRVLDHWDERGERVVVARRAACRRHPFDDLSPQEQRVVALAASGLRDKEIAGVLDSSIPTVTAALSRARRKLETRSRAEMAAAWRLHVRSVDLACACFIRRTEMGRGVVRFAFEAPPSRLTRAERAIALLIIAGEPNACIASARRVSLRTVANQIAALLKKLGVSSRTELAARFSAADLLQT